jgi:predicted nuclease of restriction endonuclease-like (RecB) superfamily
MLFERTAIANKPDELIKKELSTLRDDNVMSPDLVFKSPYFLEFTGLKGMYSEKSLEDSLVAHLEQFIVELGNGFCFVARQKRMIIDDEYYFADLVFYNRVLHCNVIIELKDDEFNHADLSQLNAYVSYYRENEMNPGDNPPVGILLCTRKGEKMVEYALAGMDNNLFVSTYMLSLPDKETLKEFILKEMNTK